MFYGHVSLTHVIKRITGSISFNEVEMSRHGIEHTKFSSMPNTAMVFASKIFEQTLLCIFFRKIIQFKTFSNFSIILFYKDVTISKRGIVLTLTTDPTLYVFSLLPGKAETNDHEKQK